MVETVPVRNSITGGGLKRTDGMQSVELFFQARKRLYTERTA